MTNSMTVMFSFLQDITQLDVSTALDKYQQLHNVNLQFHNASVLDSALRGLTNLLESILVKKLAAAKPHSDATSLWTDDIAASIADLVPLATALATNATCQGHVAAWLDQWCLEVALKGVMAHWESDAQGCDAQQVTAILEGVTVRLLALKVLLPPERLSSLQDQHSECARLFSAWQQQQQDLAAAAADLDSELITAAEEGTVAAVGSSAKPKRGQKTLSGKDLAEPEPPAKRIRKKN